MSSTAKEATGEDSEEDSSDNSVSSKPEEEDDKQPRAEGKGSDTTSTTNDPSTTSATAVGERHPTSQSVLPTLPSAAAAAAPPVPRNEKKPRRAGFREQFLQQLRVMLDRESQNNSTITHWSTDGNSFIITDQTQFESDIIPTYFDNPIVFASFLTKLYRWGFNRVSSSRQTGRYEFCSPTFKRLGPDSAPAAAAAADTPSNAGGGDSIQVQQQHAQASPLLQITGQTNHPQANALAALISNIQRSSQQPSLSSQHSVPNQNTNQQNNDVANSILQSILGINQQPLPSPTQHPTPSQQPAPNQSTDQLNNDGANNNYLQSFQQLQHPNPTMNLLNTLVGGQTSSDQLLGNHHPPPSFPSDAVHALLRSLSGQQTMYPNTNTTPAMSELNNITVQSLLALMHRVGEDERQRRAQADAIMNAIIASLGQMLGGSNNMIDEAERQRGLLAAALGQTLGSTGERTTLNVPLLRNPAGMTVSVPHNIAIQPQQVGMPPSAAAGNLYTQAAGPIAALLQAARRGMAAGPLEEDALQTQIRRDDVDNNGKDDDKDGHDERALSPRKRKSRDDEDSQRRRKKK